MMMRGPNTLDDYLKFYTSKLRAQGWTKATSEPEALDGVGFLEMKKGGLTVRITMNPSRDGKSMTLFAAGTGISIPKEKDDE
ncbi:MAG: hypothetical protein ACE5KM_17915 [Planctomycetaceae bacterium]